LIRNGELIQSLKDGKDITTQERGEMADNPDTLEEEENENPFAPHLQKNVSITRQPENEWLDDIEYAVFHYRQEAKGLEWKGTAWLEKSTGIPVKIHFQTDEIIKDENSAMKGMSGAILFQHDSPLDWYPLKIKYKMDIEWKLNFFYTFKGKVENLVSLSEYFSFH